MVFFECMKGSILILISHSYGKDWYTLCIITMDWFDIHNVTQLVSGGQGL